MSHSHSRKLQTNASHSPVHLHVIKNRNNCNYGDQFASETEECMNAADLNIGACHKRGAKKPGVNIPTNKLRGKKKVCHKRRFRSMSQLCLKKDDQKIADSKSLVGPKWHEDDTQVRYQENQERNMFQRLNNDNDLHKQQQQPKEAQIRDFNGDKNTQIIDQIRNEEIRPFKNGKDHMDLNRNQIRNIHLCKVDTRVDRSNELLQTLIEIQLSVDRCEHQIQHTFDHLKNIMTEGHVINISDINLIKDYFHETDSLLLDFKHTSRDLRHLLKQFQQHDVMTRESLIRTNSFYKEKQSELEKINNELQLLVTEKNDAISDLRKEISAKNDDSINFASTQESLENIKGHLQQQLILKTGDCNRMSVQIRILETELIKERLHKSHLLTNHNKSKETSTDDRGILKKAARAQKMKAQKAEKNADELTVRLREKEKELEQILSGRYPKSEKGKEPGIILADESIQCEIDINDSKNIFATEEHIEEPLIPFDNANKSELENSIFILKSENDNLRENVEQAETRLKRVKMELETLRQNIKTDDSKEGNQLDQQTVLLQKFELSEKSNQFSQLRIEELERQIKIYETQNLELKHSLKVIDSDNRSISDNLVLENATLKRQLENALTEAVIKPDKSRQIDSNKDRSQLSKIPDLESQITKQRSETIKLKRSYEENEKIFQRHLLEIQGQLERTEAKNRSLSTYIEYLKKSYENVFGDIPLTNGLGQGTISNIGGSMCF